MSKKILLINSDVAKNRGDRAIAEGNILLIKQLYPGCQITGISEQAKRDSEWFGIDFLDMDNQSLSPAKFIELYQQAKNSDYVFWGGGEILKDYTNKAALWYWVLKIRALKFANPNIYGLFQGLGPTKSSFSKKLIAYTVNNCKAFIVRDNESREKLIKWGADGSRIVASSDPAVLPKPASPSPETINKLKNEFDINDDFLKRYVSIGPRSWFHYSTSGILPFKYKKAIRRALHIPQPKNNEKYYQYRQALVDTIDKAIEQFDTNILLTPMHVTEDDGELCHHIKNNSRYANRIVVLDKDVFSPSELRSIIGQSLAMVGFRLHSTIIGTSANVPSMNIYYVDKGRLFFEQIKQSHRSMPIEDVLKDNFQQHFIDTYRDLLVDNEKIRKELDEAITLLREDIVSSATNYLPKD